MDIGFIGLGVMGSPMATHLARAGHRLKLLDVGTALATQLATTIGEPARVAATPQEVAQACEVVITMLPNGKVVQPVALGETAWCMRGAPVQSCWTPRRANRG